MSGMRPRIGAALAATLMMLGMACSGALATTGAVRALQPTGAEIRISATAARGDELTPQVAFNATGGEYLVVWSDTRSSPAKIYGRLLAADGTALSGNFRITRPASTAFETTPDVAWNAARNEYLVVWGDEMASAERGRDIYGRRFRADGTAIGAEFRICGDGAKGHDFFPAVAWNPVNNRYLVVWQDARAYSTRNWDIYGRQVSALGKPLGLEDLRISRNSVLVDSIFVTYIEETAPDVAADTITGGYLVVWQDGLTPYQAGGYDIRGRKVAATGKTQGADFRVNRLSAAHQQSPAVAWNANDAQYLVVWQDGRNFATGDWDIYGRRIGGDGTRLGGDIRVTSQAPHGQYTPDAAFDPGSGRYLVVWEDWRNYAAREGDTFARRLAADGTRVGGEFRVSGNAAVKHEDDPAVAYGSALDQFLVVWSDWRWDGSRGQDIVGRRVTG